MKVKLDAPILNAENKPFVKDPSKPEGDKTNHLTLGDMLQNSLLTVIDVIDKEKKDKLVNAKFWENNIENKKTVELDTVQRSDLFKRVEQLYPPIYLLRVDKLLND